MGFALSANSSIMALQIECFSSSLSDRLLVGQGHSSRPIHLNLPRFPPSRRSVLALARRRNPTSSSSSSSSKKNKKSLRHKEPAKEDDIDEDAFEALFSQLEEDLKNEDPSLDGGDDEISEEDLAMLVQELAEALGDDDIPMSDSSADDTESGNIAEADEDKEEEEEEEEEERPVKLRNWQLRRLASALKAGRRKTSIKNLAAELCLDRAVVLELLRDPPPNLLMMSAALPDEPAPTLSLSVPEPKPMETTHSEPSVHTEESGTKLQAPVHVLQHKWSAQKRLKKVQVETLERVYGRTKRPTNAMISSVVHVTNLPRKRVVKWFEDKRAEDGVPDQHPPYQRSVPETV